MILAVAACLFSGVALADQAMEEQALKARVTEFEAAWNKHDPKAVAAFWSEGGDLINPMGVVARGRAEVEKVVTADLANVVSGGTSKFTVLHIRFLKPDVAVMDLTHEVSGAKAPDGSVKPTMKVMVTGVSSKTAGKWMWEVARPMIPFVPPQGAGAAPAGK